MYIEKLVASFGVVSVALLIWRAGSVEMLHFIAICTAYAHVANEVAGWGN